ncbi:sickle tail protein homolog [Fundulus diaphanus]
MFDGDHLPTSNPFTRGCKARASLPVGSSSCHRGEKPPGVLYLQYEGETKQVRIPPEISSEDSLRALFVTAFPYQLTMKMLLPPNMAICIKDSNRNVYYDLEDLRDISPYSCLKAYHKDPVHVFHPHGRPGNTENMISKEVLYGNHSPIHRKPSSSHNTLHSLQQSLSPPMVRSMPSSPSRVAYGGGDSYGKKGMIDLGSATITHECHPGRGQSSTKFSSSSVIQERRDVKPDGDISKSKALVWCGDGGSHYPEVYRTTSVNVGGGRHSISSYCSSPPVLTGGTVDVGILGIPGGLHQYRASIKPLIGYGESMKHHTNSLHRQKSRKCEDVQIHPLGIKSPPPSPHRWNEVRMVNKLVIGGATQVSPQSMSEVRRSLKSNSSGLPMDLIPKRGSSSSTSSVFLDSPLEKPETLFPDHMTTYNIQSERMKAMEEQIASLAGLVHQSFNTTPFSQAPPLDGGLRQNLMYVKRNICELRLQLSQLKCLQLSNLESVTSMLRMAGPKLLMLICKKLAQSEDALYKQKAEMEEDRIHYLTSEEKILTQLRELEVYVECLESSSSILSQPSFTLRDVEEGTVSLQRLEEALVVLKGEFPALQAKMRSVLKLEVEAAHFLKEEPRKMDSMLKRLITLTETLSSLRRSVSNSTPSTRSAQVESLKIQNQGTATTQSPHSSPKLQPRYSVKPPLPTPPRYSVKPPLPTPPRSMCNAEDSPVASASPMKSTPTSNHHNSSPPTTSHGLDPPTVSKVS